MAGASAAAQAAVQREVEVETPALQAISQTLGAECRAQNEAWYRCKARDERSGACLMEGRAVTRCGLQLFETVEKQCQTQFLAYAQCIQNGNYRYERCRTEQKAFEACFAPHAGSAGRK